MTRLAVVGLVVAAYSLVGFAVYLRYCYLSGRAGEKADSAASAGGLWPLFLLLVGISVFADSMARVGEKIRQRGLRVHETEKECDRNLDEARQEIEQLIAETGR
jgi:hypothetical protein